MVLASQTTFASICLKICLAESWLILCYCLWCVRATSLSADLLINLAEAMEEVGRTEDQPMFFPEICKWVRRRSFVTLNYRDVCRKIVHDCQNESVEVFGSRFLFFVSFCLMLRTPTYPLLKAGQSHTPMNSHQLTSLYPSWTLFFFRFFCFSMCPVVEGLDGVHRKPSCRRLGLSHSLFHSVSFIHWQSLLWTGILPAGYEALRLAARHGSLSVFGTFRLVQAAHSEANCGVLRRPLSLWKWMPYAGCTDMFRAPESWAKNQS